MPKISIIIPVYNTEQYLEECLNSLLNQTLKDIEIICVDDESSDNSLNILNEYKLKDDRIRIYQQKHKNRIVLQENVVLNTIKQINEIYKKENLSKYDTIS